MRNMYSGSTALGTNQPDRFNIKMEISIEDLAEYTRARLHGPHRMTPCTWFSLRNLLPNVQNIYLLTPVYAHAVLTSTNPS